MVSSSSRSRFDPALCAVGWAVEEGFFGDGLKKRAIPACLLFSFSASRSIGFDASSSTYPIVFIRFDTGCHCSGGVLAGTNTCARREEAEDDEDDDEVEFVSAADEEEAGIAKEEETTEARVEEEEDDSPSMSSGAATDAGSGLGAIQGSI